MQMLKEDRVVRLYEEERDRFSALFPGVLDVDLVFDKVHFFDKPTPRDVAWYDSSDNCIHLVKAALSRSLACLRGVLRHELGHAVDVRLNEPGAEARADRIALFVTGHPILYTEEGIQHTTHGRPGRPKWLHQ
jgi:hypothetical protein